MMLSTTLSRLTRRATLLLAVVPVAVGFAQPLEAHAGTLGLYTWVLVDGPCTMTVNYDPGDIKGSAESALISEGMSCSVAEQGLAYSISDELGVAPTAFTNLCGTGRVSNFNDISVTSIPGSACYDPEAAGLHTIYVTMAVEVSTDQYVDQQFYMPAVVP